MTDSRKNKAAISKEDRCKNCEFYRSVFELNAWGAKGCYHEPYHGKYILEIKECPMQGGEEE